MNEPTILSAVPDATPPGRRPGVPVRPVPPLQPFDACHGGVALRVVLFVETVAAIGALFAGSATGSWVVHWAILSGGMLPPALGWLLLTCSLGPAVQQHSLLWHHAVGGCLGAAAGLVACATLVTALPLDPAGAPWAGSAAAGFLMAALVVAGMALRARGQSPAETAARLAELQARIRPHFLFNTLNSAIALVREEPARAETMLEDLAELFRRALMDPAATVTLAEELTLARRYLAVEEVRFGDRLRVEWQLDAAADGALLPPLLLQPLVENAVIYGVECSAEPARLRICTERRPHTVIVRVTNTVPPEGAGGRPCRDGHGIALANVRDRLFLMHDLQCSFRAERKGGLFHVRIRIPA